MIDDIDIYRAAKLLVDHHGGEARGHAEGRAAELLSAGDQTGHAVWLRIASAVDDITATKPDGPLN